MIYQKMGQLILEFLQYLRREKKWWLLPLIMLLLLFGVLLAFASSSGVGWAIYPFL